LRKDCIHSVREGLDDEIGGRLQFLGAPAIDENGLAAGVLSAIDVAPAVAYHPRMGQVESEFFCGPQQHSGRRFTERRWRILAAGIVTHLDAINRE
jgi:hypothetical protein